jgi:hypothetical protein
MKVRCSSVRLMSRVWTMSFRLSMAGFVMLLAFIIAVGVYEAFFKPVPFCPTSNPHCGAFAAGDPVYRP